VTDCRDGHRLVGRRDPITPPSQPQAGHTDHHSHRPRTFRLEDEGVSARFTIRLAEPWEIDAFVDAANETIGLSFG